MQRRDFIRLAGATAASASFAPALQAQGGFPSQPIKIMLAFAAGGSTDSMFRVLAENAGPMFGQQVLIEARPGGGGTLAATQLLQAKPDGYTVAQVPISVFRLPYTQKISWNPAADLSYIIGITGYSFGIAVPTESPIKSWADFVAYAKANPGKLSYATSGIFTTPHLTMEEISHRLGLELNHIPYKGMAEIIPAILGGQVMAVADSIGFGPHVVTHAQGAGREHRAELALRPGRPQGHGPGRREEAARRLQEGHGDAQPHRDDGPLRPGAALHEPRAVPQVRRGRDGTREGRDRTPQGLGQGDLSRPAARRRGPPGGCAAQACRRYLAPACPLFRMPA
jgi:hypothetical protein